MWKSNVVTFWLESPSKRRKQEDPWYSFRCVNYCSPCNCIRKTQSRWGHRMCKILILLRATALPSLLVCVCVGLLCKLSRGEKLTTSEIMKWAATNWGLFGLRMKPPEALNTFLDWAPAKKKCRNPSVCNEVASFLMAGPARFGCQATADDSLQLFDWIRVARAPPCSSISVLPPPNAIVELWLYFWPTLAYY